MNSMMNDEAMKRKGKKFLYGILIVLVIGKLFSFNLGRVKECVQACIYESCVRQYKVVTSYADFIEKSQDSQAIYFGSKDCPSCVSGIRKTQEILVEAGEVYYFKVDFNDPQNLTELDRFKEKYGFETIPNILIFRGGVVKQYKTKDIFHYEGGKR